MHMLTERWVREGFLKLNNVTGRYDIGLPARIITQCDRRRGRYLTRDQLGMAPRASVPAIPYRMGNTEEAATIMANDIADLVMEAYRFASTALEGRFQPHTAVHRLSISMDGEFMQSRWLWAGRGANGSPLDIPAVLSMMLSDGSLYLFHLAPILAKLQQASDRPLTQQQVSQCLDRVRLHASIGYGSMHPHASGARIGGAGILFDSWFDHADIWEAFPSPMRHVFHC